MKALIKGGFFDEAKITVNGSLISPLEFSSAILFNQWKLEAGEDEFTIMRINISGKEFSNTNSQISNSKNITYSLLDEYDHATNTSSMARTTGYTCAAAVHLMMKDMVTEKGILPPEFIGKNEKCFNFILEYLRERNVVYQIT
jgi:saccharopine dehydrogenase-like NADP-dependent oxidoreductase